MASVSVDYNARSFHGRVVGSGRSELTADLPTYAVEEILEQGVNISARNNTPLARCAPWRLYDLAPAGSAIPGIAADRRPDRGQEVMTALRRAVAAGFRDLAEPHSYVELDGLRSRPDFAALVKHIVSDQPVFLKQASGEARSEPPKPCGSNGAIAG